MGLRNSGWLWTLITATVLALGLGSLWVINSWDYPPYLMLVLAFLGLASYGRRTTWGKKLAWFGLLSVGVIGVSVLLFLPFHQTYETSTLESRLPSGAPRWTGTWLFTACFCS